MSHMNNRMKRIIAGVIALVLVLAMVLSLVVTAFAAEGIASDTVVRSGITVNGESVAGLTRSELTQELDAILGDMKDATVTMHGQEDGQVVTVSAGNLGLTLGDGNLVDDILSYGHGSNIIARYKEDKDLSVNGAEYTAEPDFDKDKITTFLTNNCEAFNRAATNASLSRYNGQFTITGGEAGIVVDKETSTDKIYEALTDGWNGEDVDIDLVFTEDEPNGTAEELAQVTDLIGTYTTYYSTSNDERKQNIANGCELINGTTLYPGEEFSVLKTITPFTEENGYAFAGSYLGDEVVESLGGGICQVSTTLYNAIIRAELQITARSNHSMIVTYVDPSADAAIAESSGMDLKFVNNTEYPVYIGGYADGGQITFNIYGKETRASNRKISFESETLTTTPSEGVRVKTDASQPIGYVKEAAGHTGYTAQLWKVVTVDGAEQSREVFNKSTYNMTPEIVTVGTAGTMTSELQAAIDAGDVAAIKTAAENAKNGTSSEGNAANSEIADQAQQAAQDAYAEALANGEDTTAAMEAAQNAANQVVSGESTESSDNSGDDAQ